jgi:hypothetical protein
VSGTSSAIATSATSSTAALNNPLASAEATTSPSGLRVAAHTPLYAAIAMIFFLQAFPVHSG